MSVDKCIRKYFNWDNNSCYIDSLFVSLFHSKNILIDNFITNLEINTSTYTNFSKTDIQKLNVSATLIQSQIENIYKQLSIHHNDDKKELCNNIRNNLQNHNNILKIYNLKNNTTNFISTYNNPIDLLEYVTNNVFINVNNITSISCDYNDYKNNNFNFDNNLIGEHNMFSDINFITIINPKKLIIKENIPNYDSSLILHSIIVNTGGHYVCYYKCNNKWYYYNDTKNDKQTRLIGNIKVVNNNILTQINTLPNKEIILLYLKSTQSAQTPAPFKQPKPSAPASPASPASSESAPSTSLIKNKNKNKNMDIDSNIRNFNIQSDNESIIQLKKLIDIHFDKLNNLTTLLK